MKEQRDTVRNFLERMDSDQNAKQKLREDLDDNYADNFDEIHPFTPALTNNSRRINELKSQPPIYLRYQEEIKKKEDTLQLMREEERKRKEDAIAKSKERLRTKSKDKRDEEERDFYQSNIEWMDKKNRRLQEERARKLDLEMSEKYDHVP